MTWSYRKTDKTEVHMNFKAPEGADNLVKEVLFPLAEKQAPAYAATLAVAVKQQSTFLQPAELTGAATINLTVNAQVTAGAKLYLKLDADGTGRAVTLGTGFDQGFASLTVKANTIAFVEFTYDGTAFVPSLSIPA